MSVTLSWKTGWAVLDIYEQGSWDDLLAILMQAKKEFGFSLKKVEKSSGGSKIASMNKQCSASEFADIHDATKAWGWN